MPLFTASTLISIHGSISAYIYRYISQYLQIHLQIYLTLVRYAVGSTIFCFSLFFFFKMKIPFCIYLNGIYTIAKKIQGKNKEFILGSKVLTANTLLTFSLRSSVCVWNLSPFSSLHFRSVNFMLLLIF